MNKVLWIIGGIVILAIAAGGGFYGGMSYQRNQANSIRNQFLRSRGLDTNNGGSFAGGSSNTQRSGQAGSGQQFTGGRGGGLTGSIKDIQGNTIQLSTPFNVTTVNLTTDTQIEKSTAGTSSDLKAGEELIVQGQRDSSGNMTASTILIMSNGTQQSNGSQQSNGAQQSNGSQQNGGASQSTPAP